MDSFNEPGLFHYNDRHHRFVPVRFCRFTLGDSTFGSANETSDVEKDIVAEGLLRGF